MFPKQRNLLLALCILSLTGCSSLGGASYSGKDAVPKLEKQHIPATKPYTIRGITYYPQKDPNEPYSEVGLASWYGDPFHGRRTSNGELFNKHKISAAHKTLTLPSYVRVTVIETGKKLIIRVNDRGPFEKGRIIDLSEEAAKVLGTHSKGLAKVKVEKLVPKNKFAFYESPEYAAIDDDFEEAAEVLSDDTSLILETVDSAEHSRQLARAFQRP